MEMEKGEEEDSTPTSSEDIRVCMAVTGRGGGGGRQVGKNEEKEEAPSEQPLFKAVREELRKRTHLF